MPRDLFRRFANWSAERVGSPWAFFASLGLILAWALAGPRFHYSDDWQLVMNTGTSIVTFLMVFLIQAMQNRDARAMHLKLDELLRAVKAARTSMVALEHLSDEELDALTAEFQRIKHRHNDPAGQISPAPPPAVPAK